MSTDSGEYERSIGHWEVESESKHVHLDVCEYRYLWEDRVGIRLNYRDRPGRSFANFSVNLPETHLGPGEFIVKSYSEHSDFWFQLESFPLFEDTGRKAILPFNFCPIWRLITHDVYAPPKSKAAAKSEDIQFSSGTSEELFAAVKRHSSGRRLNEAQRINRFVTSMQTQSRQLCLNLASKGATKGKEKEKEKSRRLKKGKDGKWTVASVAP